MKKKLWIYLVAILIILVLAGIITKYADIGCVTTGNEPKYCIKIVSDDGSKVTYWGLGYKVIRYVSVSPNEPYQNNRGVKMGSWFMKYDPPINSNSDRSIETIDDFYQTQLTQENDIRNLSKEYSLFDAQKDGCFVIGIESYNEPTYSEFMEKYQKGESAFIRVAQNTVEGNLVLQDILYDARTGKLHLIKDNTRDKFSAKEDRTITMEHFEAISEYVFENHTYWVLHHGELTGENLESEKVYVITTLR